MMMRREASVLAVILLGGALGCNSSNNQLEASAEAPGDGDEAPGDGDEAPGDGDEAPGDGDGDGEEYCDVSVFEPLEPVWVIEETGSPGQTPSVSNVAVDESGVLVVGRYKEVDGGFLERLSLTGEREWIVDEPKMTGFIGIDSTHLYFQDSTGTLILRRSVVDGAPDVGWAVTFTSAMDYMNSASPLVDGEHVFVAGGGYTEPGIGAPVDTRFAWFSKTELNETIEEVALSNPAFDDFAGAAVAMSSGGWVANIVSEGQPYTSLIGLGGVVMDAQLPMTPTARVIGLHERPNELLLFGFEGDPYETRSWVLAVDDLGQEQWRKTLAPCGPEVWTQVSGSIVASDGVWATVRVDSGPSILEEPLIVQISFDGDIQAVQRWDAPHAGLMWAAQGLAGNGDVIVLGASTWDVDNTTRNWVVRLR